MTLRINSRRRVSAVKLRSVQPWVLSLRIIEKYLDPVEEPLQNCLEFENRGHFAPRMEFGEAQLIQKLTRNMKRK
jgi:hypothetical protein